MIDQDQKDIMRVSLPEAFFRAKMIEDKLSEYLQEHPLNAKDEIDLNPHLIIDDICDVVSCRVMGDEKIYCTKEHVMLFWLSSIIYGDRMRWV